MRWFLDVLGKYAVFRGRSRRKEYWYFLLFFALISALLSALDLLAGTYSSRYQTGLFSSLFTVATFIPWVALSVRRLHDIDYSGRWLWAMLFGAFAVAVDPAIGLVILIVLSIAFAVAAMVDGTPGPSRYGPPPK